MPNTILPKNSAVHFELNKFVQDDLMTKSEAKYVERTISLYSGGGSFCTQISKCVQRFFDMVSEFFCCTSKLTKSIKILNGAQVKLSSKLYQRADFLLKSDNKAIKAQGSTLIQKLDHGSKIRQYDDYSLGVRQLGHYILMNEMKYKDTESKKAFHKPGSILATAALVTVSLQAALSVVKTSLSVTDVAEKFILSNKLDAITNGEDMLTYVPRRFDFYIPQKPVAQQ